MKFLTKSIRIFFLAFLIVFLGTIFNESGLRFHFQVLEKENLKEDSFAKIRKLLSEKENTFKLEGDNNFIQTTYAQDLDIDARAYLVIDFDSGQIFQEKNSAVPIPIASLTKIMTAIVALDLASPSEEFIISQNAADQIPTKIGVVSGQKMKLLELLEASLMTSANDATETIAEGIDQKYGEGTFIKAMNEKARFLGLKNTNFSNPQGFDTPGNFSTARDLAVISNYALNNYLYIREIAKKDYLYLPSNQNHKQFDLQNWNGLLGVYPGASGVKIGYTEDAGSTTIVTATREGKTILVVVLGAPGTLERDLWAASLLDEGFATYGLARVNITEEILQQKYDKWQYW